MFRKPITDSLSTITSNLGYQSDPDTCRNKDLNIEGILIELANKDVFSACNMLLLSKDVIHYTPLYEQLLICTGKLEVLNNIVAQSSDEFEASKQRLQSLYLSLCRDFEITEKCLNILFFSFQPSTKDYYDSCISSIIQVVSELIWSYSQSNEVFQFEYAKCDAKVLTDFDLEIIKSLYLFQPFKKNELRFFVDFDITKSKACAISNDKSALTRNIFNIKKKSLKAEIVSAAPLSVASSTEVSSCPNSQSISQLSMNYLPKFEIEAISQFEDKRILLKPSTLKTFKFVDIKRESIDKKVMRKFMNVLSKSHATHYEGERKRIVECLKAIGSPPTVVDGKPYKSFNTSYMLLLFSITGLKDLYDLFLKDRLQEVLGSIYTSYGIAKVESKLVIEKYVLDIGNIFTANVCLSRH